MIWLYFLGVKCLAHTLHLAIMDAFKVTTEADESTTFNDVLKAARNVVKELRSQVCSPFLKQEKLPKPLLDCPTRLKSVCWLSVILLL
jgi:hypothetical protein